MDNFDMAELLDIIGVRNTQITWGHYEPEFPKDGIATSLIKWKNLRARFLLRLLYKLMYHHCVS